MNVQEHANGVRTRPATDADRDRCLQLIELLTGRSQSDGWAEVFSSSASINFYIRINTPIK